MNDWNDAVVDIALQNNFMVISSATSAGVPWVSPVVYACDQKMRFYWVSAEEARHSANVAENPRAAIAVFDSTQTPGNVQAVYAEGSVERLESEELAEALPLFYGWRYPDPDVLRTKIRGPEQFEGSSPRRMYRLTPDNVYGLDPDGHPIHGTLLDHRVPVSVYQKFAARYTERYKHSI